VALAFRETALSRNARRRWHLALKEEVGGGTKFPHVNDLGAAMKLQKLF
jgi:hypothetical protein